MKCKRKLNGHREEYMGRWIKRGAPLSVMEVKFKIKLKNKSNSSESNRKGTGARS